MPTVGKKKFPYTKKGIKAAVKESESKKEDLTMDPNKEKEMVSKKKTIMIGKRKMMGKKTKYSME